MAKKNSIKLIKMPNNKATFKTAERNYFVEDRTAAEPRIFSMYVGRIIGGAEPIKRRRELRTDTPLYATLKGLLQPKVETTPEA